MDNLEEFDATRDVFTTYRTSNATDSIAHPHMKDLKMPLKAEYAIKDAGRAECGEALSCAQKAHQKAENKSTYRKSTVQWYMNIAALTSSKFTSCCIMKNQFGALDTESETTLKCSK